MVAIGYLKQPLFLCIRQVLRFYKQSKYVNKTEKKKKPTCGVKEKN